MTILDEIAAKTRERILLEKKQISPGMVRRRAEEMARKRRAQGTSLPFEKALSRQGMSFICEVKKASPSKGIIAKKFPWLEIAREYERSGAAAISCLTEPGYFLGKDEYLEKIAETVNIPVLRKDFTVEEYMIYQARALGADAVLLICSLLDDSQLKAFGQLAAELGMASLVETHDEREIQRAVKNGARVIGVNNRNLKDFSVDTGNSSRLRQLAPREVLFVAESGISHPDQVAALEADGVDAVLVGETLMRATDKGKTLRWLAGQPE